MSEAIMPEKGEDIGVEGLDKVVYRRI